MAKQKEIKDSNVLSIIIKYIIPILGFLGGVFALGYHCGKWQSSIDHKTEIMEIRQEYYNEISNLKIDYNNHIIELQNELKIKELSNKQ